MTVRQKPATKKEKRKERIRALENKLMVLESQLVHKYHFAGMDLHKLSTDRLMASGCIIKIMNLEGRSIIDPVLIKDGLSDKTIEAIREDLKRSYDLAVEFKPVMKDPTKTTKKQP